jgi:hypothetical protein
MKPRYHLASAYKGAVAIYMSQGTHRLYESNTVGIPVTVSLDQIILHIGSISREDAHFKSLVCPVFFIGAEARQESQRMAIVQVLSTLDYLALSEREKCNECAQIFVVAK